MAITFLSKKKQCHEWNALSFIDSINNDRMLILNRNQKWIWNFSLKSNERQCYTCYFLILMPNNIDLYRKYFWPKFTMQKKGNFHLVMKMSSKIKTCPQQPVTYIIIYAQMIRYNPWKVYCIFGSNKVITKPTSSHDL